MKLILASASPRRRDLLAQIGIVPDAIIAADIDETPLPNELPRPHAERLAFEKASAATQNAFILAADTVVGVGRRILPKAETPEQVRACLDLLSGRAHQVITAIALRDPAGKIRTRTVLTRVKFKRLNTAEIGHYIESVEGLGKAGGYAIQGLAGAFVTHINGSYSAIVGLPLYETRALLEGAGFTPSRSA